jgi:hypothetical protein
VVEEGLKYTSFALTLGLYLVERQGERVSHRVRWLELLGEHAFGGEDAQQHLHATLKLFRSQEAFAHSAHDPAGARCPAVPGSDLLPRISARR